MRFSILLFGMVQALKITARMHPDFRERLKEKNFTAQFKLQDNSEGRWIKFENGKIKSKKGLCENPDISVFFRNRAIAEDLMTPPVDQLAQIDAMKNFKIGMVGSDELGSWLMTTLNIMQNIGWKYGVDVGDGVMRYANATNGGPVFVYVKDGRILRTTPIELDDKDAPSWTIEARGKTFTPPRRTTLSPHGLALKSLVYSKERLLYPMKRVDFDPDGERNILNRGISGYERISWEEALDIVAAEIKRAKRKGPGAVCVTHGSHHQWGNVGYYLSALFRFFNLIGYTKVENNPDSWEGWYWGATHHWGHSMRLGGGEFYGTVEDCLKNAEMIIYWSSDPEATNGCYGSFEGTVRRGWAKQLGIKMVHIDPYMNHTAALFGGKWIAPRVTTDPALAQAICYVWITEDLYDKYFVENRTTGFDEWKDYVLGNTDGTPRTPEWQEPETGVPARDVRALAREWGSKKTYLAAGGFGNTTGGACRSATGIQWARMMVILNAMQGMGRPGVNFGCLQIGAPLDYSFYFPGYAEGGISGELQYTASSVNNYQRMPHILTMNTSSQVIPRLKLPEAIIDGETEGYITNPSSVTKQFLKFKYPAPGHAKIEMLYRYGGAYFGTMTESNRWVKMYRSENLPFVVNQSVWNEGETKFADIILPACTNIERWDIGEWMSAGGYVHHMFSQANHRVVSIQHKCIEPLGESKSDYNIFFELAQRLGLGAMFSEGGNTEIDWCKRVFDSSDVSKFISWKKFLKKGYFVVPAEPEKTRAPTSLNWFYEGRPKDVPEPHPLPADNVRKFGEGLQTPSGKFEFIPETLKRIDDPGRPPLNRYIPSWEGALDDERREKYPLQLLTPHTRYSFHSLGDGKDSTINDIKDHRILIDGHYYLVARISGPDAEKRGIKNDDLIRLWNGRGSVVCAAFVTERLRPGIVNAYQASAIYQPVGEPGNSTDLGGCVNMLTPSRNQTEQVSSMSPNSALIQIEKWTGIDTWQGSEVV